MNNEEAIARTAEHVESLFTHESSGHDWYHIHRVWQMSYHLAKAETADRFVVQLAALLHDIADWKFHGGDDTAGPREAARWLNELAIPEPIVEHVCDIIARLSFKGAHVPTPMPTLEGQIVQDADRLDALGAIGIARTFAYGGHKGSPMHDPRLPPRLHLSFEEYKTHQGTTINHFYEKLLLLKHRMNTAAAREIAEQRHQFMEQFLSQFFSEWNVEPNRFA